jgi:hypothetical protein
MEALKEFAADYWYRALTFLSGAGVVGAAAIGNDPMLRKALLLLCIGGALIGLGQWIDHPYQERVDPYGRFKVSGRTYRASIGGTILQFGGIALAIRGIWLLW